MLFFLSAAFAAQLNAPAMCEVAARVVLAEVTSRWSAWDENGRIVTHVSLSVIRAYKGGSEDAELLVPGGTIGGVVLTVGGVPNLQTDHRYLLPLSANGDGTYRLTSLAAVVAAGSINPNTYEVCHAR